MNRSFCPVYSAVKTPWSDSFCTQERKKKKKEKPRHSKPCHCRNGGLFCLKEIYQKGSLCAWYTQRCKAKLPQVDLFWCWCWNLCVCFFHPVSASFLWSQLQLNRFGIAIGSAWPEPLNSDNTGWTENILSVEYIVLNVQLPWGATKLRMWKWEQDTKMWHEKLCLNKRISACWNSAFRGVLKLDLTHSENNF